MDIEYSSDEAERNKRGAGFILKFIDGHTFVTAGLSFRIEMSGKTFT